MPSATASGPPSFKGAGRHGAPPPGVTRRGPVTPALTRAAALRNAPRTRRTHASQIPTPYPELPHAEADYPACDVTWSITFLKSSVGENSTNSQSSRATGTWPGDQ